MRDEKVCFVDNNNDSKSKSIWFDCMDVVISVILMFSLVNLFLFRTINVSGESMMSTLHDKDRMVITNCSYIPNNGDIVVVNTSNLNLYEGGQKVDNIIKRVIATEDQSLKINFNTGEVYVDGNLLDEPYISTPTVKGTATIPEIIPEGYVFVMGDNRSNSSDSRFKMIGLVDKNNIIGKAQFTMFPFNRFGSPY